MPHANRDNAVNRRRVYRVDESSGLLRNRAQRVPTNRRFTVLPFFSLPPPHETTVPSLPRRSLSAPSSSFAPEKLEIFNLNREQMDFSLTNYYQPVRIPALELFRGVFGLHRREEIIVQDFNDFDSFYLNYFNSNKFSIARCLFLSRLRIEPILQMRVKRVIFYFQIAGNRISLRGGENWKIRRLIKMRKISNRGLRKQRWSSE